MTSWRVRIFISTWCAYAGYYFCRKAFYVVKGSFSEELGIDTAALGEIGVAYLIAYALGQFINGALGTKFGARILLLCGMALSIACNVVFGLSNGYWTLLVFMTINGFAQSSGWASVVSTLGHWTERKERGTVMGVWSTCYQLGGVMASAWAAFWLGRHGWRVSFFAASAALLGAWTLVLFFQRNKPEDVGLPRFTDEDTEDDDDSAVVWTRSLITTIALAGLTYFGIKFVRYALWSWAPYFLQQSYGAAGDDAGYLSTIFDIAGFAGVIVAGVVSDRFAGGRRAPVAFIMLIGLVGACAIMYTLGASSILWFAVSLGLVGFTLYGPDSLLVGTGAVDVGSRRTALAAAGIINGMGSVGAVTQELVVSRLYEGSVGPIFAALLAAATLSLITLSVVVVRNKKGLSNL